MSLTTPVVIGILLVVIQTILSLGVFPLYFIKYRNDSIIRARSLLLEFNFWFWILIFQYRLFEIVYDIEYPGEIPCSVIIWTGWSTPITIIAITIKCVRLILIYVSTKNRLRLMDEEYKKPLINVTASWYSDKYLAIGLLVSWFFFGLFPMSITIYAFNHFGSFTQEVCGTIAFRISAIVSFVILIFCIIACVYQLIKVHDAYRVKWELRAIGYIALLIALPSYGLTFATNAKAAIWGWVVLQIVCILLTICSNILVVWYAHQERNRRISQSSGSETFEGSFNNDTVADDEGVPKLSSRATKLSKLVKDQNAVRYIEEYLVHYQETRLSNAYLLSNTLKKLKDMQEPLIFISRAYMMYGKFLSNDAYIFTDILPNSKREEMKTLITSAVDIISEEGQKDQIAETAQKVHDAIDELLATLNDLLTEELFRPFMKSKFYQDFQKNNLLSESAEEHVLVNTVQ